MNVKKITLIIIAVTIVVLLAWDVYAILMGGTEASISSIIITSSYKFPLIPFFGGLLAGHFWWRMKSNPDTKDIDQMK